MSNAISPSIRQRAFMAVVLFVGFYVLALSIAALLIALLFAMIIYTERLNGRIAAFLLIGAGAILWSIIPRRDRFEAPGPQLLQSEHPKFFAEIEDIADKTQQAMPVHVYLVADINAWVANRGGIMAIGSKRVMGIGLPLLQLLTINQFRAVLAHEFGHYYGGDTRLGPWIYKTRSAIERTIKTLSGHSSMLQRPFLWYGTMFLRTTQKVSRQQEFSADALAARVVGAQPLVSGLKKVSGGAYVYQLFWRNWLSPVLDKGYHPPLAEGFLRFADNPDIQVALEHAAYTALTEQRTNIYDSHPSLQSRIEAVAGLPQGLDPSDGPPAISLLENVSHEEDRLFSSLADLNDVADLKPIRWEDVGIKVYVPMWTEFVDSGKNYLKGITPSSYPRIAAKPKEYLSRFPKMTTDAQRQSAISLLGAALAVLLHNRQWELNAQINEPVCFRDGNEEISPFLIIKQLSKGELTSESWLHQCEYAGISDVDLGESATK